MRLPVVLPSPRGSTLVSLPLPVRRVLALVLVATALSSPFACAQDTSAPAYTIRPGDALSIEVPGHPEWSLSVTVRPDGRITYPATGEIEVAGRTLAQLTEQIEYALGPGGRHLRSPNVVINVTGMRTPVVYVLGAVASPGAVELPTGVSTSTKVLTRAGGAAPEADLSRVALYRDDGSVDTIDLEAQLEGRLEHTVIRAGDVLMLPQTTVRYVGVLGAVGRTGEIPLPPHQHSFDMLELLVKIGGVGEQADRERAMILREDGSIDSFMVDRVLSREIEPPQIHAGDVLWVPTLPPDPETEYFAVTGAVQSAGRFEYREGITLADALALSGQPAEAANPRNVTIIHADGEKQVVDIRPMLYGQDTEIARMPIMPDDIILVPAHDRSYVVLGAVGQTGFFPWAEETRIADALAKSGGLRSEAAAERVMLVRRAEDGGSPTVMEIDARLLLQGGNEAANWKLLAGDTLYVPYRERRPGLRETLAEPLTILGLVGTLGRLVGW